VSTDPGAISGVRLVAIALGVVTAFTKFATGNWAARRAGSSERGRVRAGLLLIPRGEFSIIIAGLGAGLVGGEQLPALAAVYVLLMVIAGPLVVRLHQTWIANPVSVAK
jgi:CPA2 family monovalent cation:H+ antiporter-2